MPTIFLTLICKTCGIHATQSTTSPLIIPWDISLISRQLLELLMQPSYHWAQKNSPLIWDSSFCAFHQWYITGSTPCLFSFHMGMSHQRAARRSRKLSDEYKASGCPSKIKSVCLTLSSLAAAYLNEYRAKMTIWEEILDALKVGRIVQVIKDQ